MTKCESIGSAQHFSTLSYATVHYDNLLSLMLMRSRDHVVGRCARPVRACDAYVSARPGEDHWTCICPFMAMCSTDSRTLSRHLEGSKCYRISKSHNDNFVNKTILTRRLTEKITPPPRVCALVSVRRTFTGLVLQH